MINGTNNRVANEWRSEDFNKRNTINMLLTRIEIVFSIENAENMHCMWTLIRDFEEETNRINTIVLEEKNERSYSRCSKI